MHKLVGVEADEFGAGAEALYELGERGAVDARVGAQVDDKSRGAETIDELSESERVLVVEGREHVQLADRAFAALHELLGEAALEIGDELRTLGWPEQPLARSCLEIEPAVREFRVAGATHDRLRPLAPASDRRELGLVLGVEAAEDLVTLLDPPQAQIPGSDEEDAALGVAEEVGLGVEGDDRSRPREAGSRDWRAAGRGSPRPARLLPGVAPVD